MSAELSRSCQEMVPGLFLGPIACADDAAYLASLGITHRVTCLAEPLAAVEHVATAHIAIKDNNVEQIEPLLLVATPFIARALAQGGRVLVHCSSGASRSATVVIAFLMQFQDFGLRGALRHVSARRSCILPATTFYATLQTLDANLCAAQARIKQPATMFDYNVQQLRAVTSQPLELCEETLRACKDSVDDAIDALFSLKSANSNGESAAAAAPVKTSADGSVLVFTYGTLMRGFRNHENLMGNAEFLGRHETVNKYALFAAGVPFVHPDLARTPVQGELFRVAVADLAKLDGLEGHPDFYYRDLVDVVPVNETGDAALPAGAAAAAGRTQAWLYFNRFVSDLADSMAPAVYIPTGNYHDAAKFGNPTGMG